VVTRWLLIEWLNVGDLRSGLGAGPRLKLTGPFPCDLVLCWLPSLAVGEIRAAILICGILIVVGVGMTIWKLGVDPVVAAGVGAALFVAAGVVTHHEKAERR
jgi:hypothetical protein